MNNFLHPLTLVTFFPLLGVVVLLFLRSEQKAACTLGSVDYFAGHLRDITCRIGPIQSLTSRFADGD